MHPMAILCAHFIVATYLCTLTQWDDYVGMACDCDIAVRNMDVSVRNVDFSVRNVDVGVRNEDISIRNVDVSIYQECGCKCQE